MQYNKTSSSNSERRKATTLDFSYRTDFCLCSVSNSSQLHFTVLFFNSDEKDWGKQREAWWEMVCKSAEIAEGWSTAAQQHCKLEEIHSYWERDGEEKVVHNFSQYIKNTDSVNSC